MAAATSVRGREEEGGGGSRRREEGGREKPRGPRRRPVREGGRRAERSGAGPAPSLRLGAGARFRPPLPVLVVVGRAGLGGWSLQMSLREACWRETLSRHSLVQTLQPKKDSPRELFSTDEFPVQLAAPPQATHSHKDVICHEDHLFTLKITSNRDSV